MLEEIRKSTYEEFSDQLVQSSAITQGLLGLSLLPPTAEVDEAVLSMAQMESADLERNYSKRMEIFELLERNRSEGKELTPEKKREIRQWLQVLNNLDIYIRDHYDDERKRTLYDRQMTVFEDIRNQLERGIRYGSIQLPTGIGKTVLFTEISEATDVETLILVPTLDLLDQTEEKFERFAPDVEVGKVDKRRKEYGKQVTVMTYASLISQVKRGHINPDNYDLVILDEEHRSRGDATQKALSTFDKSIMLGFSATPFEFENRNEIHKMSVVEGVEEGLLADFSVWWVTTDIQLPKLRSNGEYDEEELNKALNIPKRNKAAVDLYKNDFFGTPTFAYCSSIAHAQDLAEMFNTNGVKAAAMWGEMGKTERTKILNEFRVGKIQVLCNNKLLREGIDVPSAKLCLRLSPGFSVVDTAQEGGRVLRLFNDKAAYIVEFHDIVQKGDIPPLSYAEVVGTASASKRTVSRSSKNRPAPPPPRRNPIDFEGITIITDVEEIMKVIGERKVKRPSYDYKQEGFLDIPLQQFMQDYDIGNKQLQSILYTIASDNPEFFTKSNKRGNPLVVTPEGYDLITEKLEKWKKQLEYIEMPSSRLLKEYSIGKRQLRELIQKLQNEFPDQIIIHGSGKPNLYTLVGLGIVLTALEDRTIVQETMEEINRSSILEEFGISTVTLKSNIQALMEEYPEDFKFQEGKPYIATKRGHELLMERLESRRPVGYVLLHISDLTAEFDLNPKTIYAVLDNLIDKYPNLFIKSQGHGYPHQVAGEGLTKLRTALEYKVRNKWKGFGYEE